MFSEAVRLRQQAFLLSDLLRWMSMYTNFHMMQTKPTAQQERRDPALLRARKTSSSVGPSQAPLSPPDSDRDLPGRQSQELGHSCSGALDLRG